MFKLMHKKLNKKGFTLAELLIVVAIVAILVAIAIPIFTDSLEQAQIRTNEANLRSTRAAAVEHILAHWNEPERGKDSLSGVDNRYYREGAKKISGLATSGEVAPGWYAIGKVDKAGNLEAVHVFVNLAGNHVAYEVDSENVNEGVTQTNIAASGDALPKDEDDITKIEDSGNISPAYYTFVFITDTDIKAGGTT